MQDFNIFTILSKTMQFKVVIITYVCMVLSFVENGENLTSQSLEAIIDNLVVAVGNMKMEIKMIQHYMDAGRYGHCRCCQYQNKIVTTASNPTITTKTIAAKFEATSTPSQCYDKLPNCTVYGKTFCHGQFQRWAEKNCATYCGFCVNGGWSPWRNASTCSVTCGGGTLMQTRTCDNPAPQFGGQICHGNDSRVITCNSVTCPNICGKHWVEFEGSCYLFFNKNAVLWQACLISCQFLKGSLLEIENAKENDFIISTLRSFGNMTRNYWIGGYLPTGSDGTNTSAWKWVGSRTMLSQTFTNWAPGEPSPKTRKDLFDRHFGYCLALEGDQGYKYTAHDCRRNSFYMICEKNATLPDSS